MKSKAFGAVVAQVWQAVGSFGLQLLAAWLLGASGLGLLSLCLSVIVLATAVTSGMVGDSLVILDRHDRGVRGGLQFWALVLAGVSLLATAVALPAFGLLSVSDALLMAFALAAFQLEELVRRVFMATMRFWRVVIVDGCAVAAAMAVVGIWAVIEPVRISTFFTALLVGQVVGIAVGVSMLPPSERRLVSLRGARLREVAAFGAWRGAQISVPPLVLTSMRVAVTAMTGAAALGQLELARIYVAPAMLTAQGLGAYLLSSYVRDKQQPLAALIRRAWRACLGMIGGALLAGAAVILVAPLVAPTVSGPQVDLDRIALAGWSLYVVGSASCQPFASLAAARGRPAQVLRCRLVDAAVAVGSLPILFLVGVPAAWTPWVLAAGLVLGGVLVRRFALAPLARGELRLATEAAEPGSTYALP